MADATHSTSWDTAELLAAWMRTIPPLDPSRSGERKAFVRPVAVRGDIAFVPLTQGLEAVIDAADVSLVEGRNWHARRDRGVLYASRSRLRGEDAGLHVLLHRVIMAPPANAIVDHINGIGLDCRRSNLRLANEHQNKWNIAKTSRNTSGFKGVSYVKARGNWQASIRASGRVRYLGRFTTPEEAYEAYCDAARKLHGEFVNLG